VLDLWVHRWRRREATGEVIVTRYADDVIVGFQHQADAQRFRQAVRARLAAFGLELHPTKTRLIEFGRFAAERRARRGEGKPATFDFLGFTHCCSRTRQGEFAVRRLTVKKRMRAALTAPRDTLKRRRHEPVGVIGPWLRRVVDRPVCPAGAPDSSAPVATLSRHCLRQEPNAGMPHVRFCAGGAG
jgi:hypothetical protein